MLERIIQKNRTPELLSNPRFEEESDWLVTGGTMEYDTVNNRLEVSGNWTKVYQAFPTVIGETYYVRIRKISEGGGEHFRLTTIDPSLSPDPDAFVKYLLNNLSTTFVATATISYAVLLSGELEGSIWDMVSIRKV